MRGMHYYGGMGPGMGLLGAFFGLLFLVGLVALVVVLVRMVANRRGGQPFGRYVPPQGGLGHLGFPNPNDPLRILDDRLARGDISIEDYHARKKALTDPEPPPSPEI